MNLNVLIRKSNNNKINSTKMNALSLSEWGYCHDNLHVAFLGELIVQQLPFLTCSHNFGQDDSCVMWDLNEKEELKAESVKRMLSVYNICLRMLISHTFDQFIVLLMIIIHLLRNIRRWYWIWQVHEGQSALLPDLIYIDKWYPWIL